MLAALAVVAVVIGVVACGSGSTAPTTVPQRAQHLSTPVATR